MTDVVLRDPLSKRALRWGWSAALGAHGVLSAATSGGSGDVRIFYGGARPGDVGGPLVKVKRLGAAFPESWWRYTLVYTLSNTPYLPGIALQLLKHRGVPIVHNQDGVFYPGWFRGDWRALNARMARNYHLGDHVFLKRFLPHLGRAFLGHAAAPARSLQRVTPGTSRRRRMGRNARGNSAYRHRQIDEHLFYRLESTSGALRAARRHGLVCGLTIAGWSPRLPWPRPMHLSAKWGSPMS